LDAREKRASIAIAMTFLALAIAVVSVAAVHLSEESEPDSPVVLMALSAPSILIFGALGGIKLWLGYLLARL
jgi:hypothetical protein